MANETPSSANPKALTWAGWVLTLLPVPLFAMSAVSKFTRAEEAVKGMAQFGYAESILLPLGVVEVTGVVLFLIPQTAVLGAVLLTGYLGGAAATHIRVADYPHAVIPVALGAILWLALVFRDPRMRQLLPWRS